MRSLCTARSTPVLDQEKDKGRLCSQGVVFLVRQEETNNSMPCRISFAEIDILVQFVRHAKAPLVNYIYIYVHIQISRDLQFQFSFSLSMSIVGRRPFPLTSTGPRFAQHDASVLPNSLNRPSISSSVFLGSLCSRGVQNVMKVCPTVFCSSRHMNSPIQFEFAYRFHNISYFDFSRIH